MGLLQDKVVIITGAGSGVGQAAAKLFAEHGAKVMALDVVQARLDETAALMKAAGSEGATGLCDVGDEAAVADAIAKTVAKFGRLDVMYNNAGIASPPKEDGRPKPFIDCTAEDWSKLQRVNIEGVINGCRQAILQFDRQGGGGVIVNTASIAGLMGYGGVIYGTTKGAVVNLTRALAMEIGPKGIRINSVCPGGMFTNFGMGPMMDDAALEAGNKALADGNPLRDVIGPKECADAALFLASDLSAKITGVNLPVDAGYAAGR